MERPGPTARTDGAPRKAHKMTETRRKQKDPEKGQEPPDGIRRGAAVPSPPSYHTTGFPASATPPAFRDLHDAHPMVSETPLAFTLRLEEEGGGFVDPGRCTLVLHVGWDGQQEVLERRRTFQLKGPSRWPCFTLRVSSSVEKTGRSRPAGLCRQLWTRGAENLGVMPQMDRCLSTPLG